MKRYIAILAAVLLLACTACGKKQAPSDTLDSEGLVTASTQEMIYKNSSYTLRFTKNEEGKWQWKDDTTLPLDQTLMQQLLDQVSALNTLTPLENPGDITAYDLDGPDRTLEVKNDDGTGLSLQIGAAAEGGGYYMCRDKDTTKIYVAPDALVQLMDRNIYELVEMPTLPALTAGQAYAYSGPGRRNGRHRGAGRGRQLAMQRGGRVRPDDGAYCPLGRGHEAGVLRGL